MNYNKKWYDGLKKSPLNPPAWVFSVVWPILYTTMAIALYMVWTDKKCYPFCNPLYFFFIQLFFNLIWTNLFFTRQRPDLALINTVFILIFTCITIVQFSNINKTASYILWPYFGWLLFAFFLNTYIVVNN